MDSGEEISVGGATEPGDAPPPVRRGYPDAYSVWLGPLREEPRRRWPRITTLILLAVWLGAWAAYIWLPGG
ncbi:hypothetical protein [Nocardia crassostreae]|uniref:hypothetical protein n=1 Tax=Nocardia crassostreae TaxID=53428 RepID=UPI00082A8F32|nr:hypothetical protein [Nocardia crassostreae]